MNGFIEQLRIGLVLAARNRMALVYGFVFPLIFLFSFLAIYRHEQVPLALHLGALLTVTVLGGACFGLPTSMVSERERGVWRRYLLTPVPIAAFIGSALVVRFVLLLAAGSMQIAVALAIGMPPPSHPIELFIAFVFVCFAFLGLGMLIAALADNVPAVQALGQCVFLPMLMIGGVAVPLSSLPDWALHASAFFPGRYAVQALQQCVTGNGLVDVRFDVLALVLIGGAAGLAAMQLLRWNTGQVFRLNGSKRWLTTASGMWLLVGSLAEIDGRIAIATPPVEKVEAVADYIDRRVAPAAIGPASSQPVVDAEEKQAAMPPVVAKRSDAKLPDPTPAVPRTWRDVTASDLAGIAFERLPPDSGLVSPIAGAGDKPGAMIAAQLDAVRAGLVKWPPGQVPDAVQRVRNHLYVAAVADVMRMEQLERFVPLTIFERLQRDLPREDLIKLLYWVALHPQEGDDTAVGQLEPLGLPAVSGPTATARGRVMLYAFKMLGRLTGDIGAGDRSSGNDNGADGGT